MAWGTQELRAATMQPDYFEIRDAATLLPPVATQRANWSSWRPRAWARRG